MLRPVEAHVLERSPCRVYPASGFSFRLPRMVSEVARRWQGRAPGARVGLLAMSAARDCFRSRSLPSHANAHQASSTAQPPHTYATPHMLTAGRRQRQDRPRRLLRRHQLDRRVRPPDWRQHNMDRQPGGWLRHLALPGHGLARRVKLRSECGHRELGQNVVPWRRRPRRRPPQDHLHNVGPRADPVRLDLILVL